MRIMAIDYGDVRTGIALCDKNEILATAHSVIAESYAPKLADKIAVLVEQEGAQLVVIGLPRNMDGSYGFRAEACRELGTILEERISVPVEYEDERLTTVIAHDILSENNVRGKKRKNTVDAVSASVILQSYIDKRKNK